MLGVFDGSKFEGTDKLSMCVINDALEFIENLNSSKNKSVVFVEGDRLFNKRFLESTKAYLFVTQVSSDLISLRHKSREDNQTERFLRSRQTKLDNILKEYSCVYLKNNTNFDLELAVNRLCSTAKSFLVS